MQLTPECLLPLLPAVFSFSTPLPEDVGRLLMASIVHRPRRSRRAEDAPRSYIGLGGAGGRRMPNDSKVGRGPRGGGTFTPNAAQLCA